MALVHPRRFAALVGAGALMCASLATAGSSIPAGGADTSRHSAQVRAGLIPLAGAFDCDVPGTPGDAILWYSPNSANATLWTDLSGDATLLRREQRVRVPTRATPVLGDFDGDRCTDVLWVTRGGTRASLLWGSADGLRRGATITLASTPVSQLVPLRAKSGAHGLYLFRSAGRDIFLRPTGRRSRPFRVAAGPQIDGAGVLHALRTRDTLAPALVHIPSQRTPTRSTLMRLRATRSGLALAGRSSTTIARGTRVASCGNQLILHRPGAAPDEALTLTARGGVRRSAVAMPGTFTIAASGDATDRCLVVWSPPSNATRTIWRGRVLPTATPPPPGGGPTIAVAHPRILLNSANRARLAGMLANAAPSAARFRAYVDSALAGGNPYGFEPWEAALVGQLTTDPRYCSLAVTRTDQFVASERGRIAASTNPEVAGDSYLEVGPIIGSLAMTYDWCHETLTATQRERWIAYANQAVWNVWNHETASWGGRAAPWSGWSVDNPSNNYYYSFLKATMLLGLATNGENPHAATWIATFRTAKIQDQLIPTFTRDLAGGGSREGTGYGTAMKNLFWLYELWESSTGESLDQLTPHTRMSMPYLMHSTVPTLDRLAPIGDHSRDSSAELFDYHREYALALAWLQRGDTLAAPLRQWLTQISVPQMGQGFERVFDFVYDDSAGARAPLSQLATTYFGSGTGHLFARSSWATDATWVGFNMGPYTESHAHQDQLSLLLFAGRWQAYDANVESHSGIVQDTRAHNLVRIERGGTVLPQREGNSSQVLALADTAQFAYAAADATAVYGANSGVNRVQREIVYLKPDVLVVYDRVDAGAGSTFTWQLNSPVDPVVAGTTTTFGGGNDLVMRAITPSTSATTVALAPSFDGENYAGGFRRELRVSGDDHVEFLTVLSVDGAVSDAVSSPAPGQDGVLITLAGGGSAQVRFNTTSPGGHLTLSGGAGSHDAGLPTGVSPLPLLAG